jgi:hypothetical protein
MERTALQAVGARYLLAEKTRIFLGRLGSIHCVVDEKDAYANVYCALCFPVRFPTRYVTVCYTDEENKEQEIGVIEDLDAFPAETQAIVRASLNRQYFEQTVARIYEVRWEFGLLFFEVETAAGRKEFMMRWQHDRAIDYGDSGKVLLDVFDNRYVIPSVEKLPNGDRDRLMRFIYW